MRPRFTIDVAEVADRSQSDAAGDGYETNEGDRIVRASTRLLQKPI
jgi:hypothetical protein